MFGAFLQKTELVPNIEVPSLHLVIEKFTEVIKNLNISSYNIYISWFAKFSGNPILKFLFCFPDDCAFKIKHFILIYSNLQKV